MREKKRGRENINQKSHVSCIISIIRTPSLPLTKIMIDALNMKIIGYLAKHGMYTDYSKIHIFESIFLSNNKSEYIKGLFFYKIHYQHNEKYVGTYTYILSR